MNPAALDVSTVRLNGPQEVPVSTSAGGELKWVTSSGCVPSHYATRSLYELFHTPACKFFLKSTLVELSG